MTGQKVLILGGGTAGWMTACLMAKRWIPKGIKVTLVESPEIGIIGVGEGSTPKLKDFFDSLGIDEAEWMPACHATYKNGIRFAGWSTVPGCEEYFHPFGCTLDSLTFKFLQANSVLRRKGLDVNAHPNQFFLMSRLADKHLAPIAHENFPFQFDYAYHFDAVLVGQFLRKKAVAWGVDHVEATVADVGRHENGDLSHLVLKCGRHIDADFFVDCSGFAAILLQKILQVPFLPFADNLFNNSAVAMPTPLPTHLPAETVSTAFSNGWAWRIPLTTRFGNGYVYSDDHISADEAETELRTHLGLLDAEVEARHLKMRVGRTASSWHKNCVGIGLSQGFIEPLEATALQFVHTSIEEFMSSYERGDFSATHREAYCRSINRHFEGIRDYIVLHYKSNSRKDSQYWIDNRENEHISDNLRAMLHCWNQVTDLNAELERLGIGGYYTAISWNCLMSGVGLYPDPDSLRPLQGDVGQADLAFLDDFMERCTLNFDDHATFLENRSP